MTDEERPTVTELDSSINKFIDEIHFRSSTHLMHKLQNKFPNVEKKHLQRIIDSRLKDHFGKTFRVEPYYVKIFSHSPNCWFHDLMDNGKDQEPRYWHIFIGTNTHYAVALPLNDKKASSVKKTLAEFINEYKPYKLTSDEESAFIEKGNVKLLTDHKVRIHIITEQNHSALGIIDRFIRTLRDMNIPVDKSKRQSHDVKYKSITPKRMKKLLEIYNSTYHSRIKCTPFEMFTDGNKEKEYIFEQIDKKERQEGIKNFHLEDGWFVRYLLSRNTGMTKKRFQYSWECYKISSHRGNMYTLMAQDGTVMNLPRYRLLLCNEDGTKPKNIKWAETIPGQWNGEISKIISYDKKTNKYTVEFKMNDDKTYVDEIPASYLRGNFPQDLSEMEREFRLGLNV